MQNTLSNSANSANGQPNTPKISDASAHVRAEPHVDSRTVMGIARLCAKALSETEASRLFGLRPSQWFGWKRCHNNAKKFAELLEQVRADRIYALIAGIGESAD